MYPTYAFEPLPRAIDVPSSTAHRRFHVAQHAVSQPALEAFNQLRASFDERRPPIDPDQLATAARSLDRMRGRRVPDCVAERLQCAYLALRASRDQAWHAPEPVVETLHRVLAYLRATDDLIPDKLPTIGRFDDAMIVDAAWPLLHDEVTAYADFRHLRARLQDVDPHRGATFDRSAWLDFRRALADADQHARQVRWSSYLAPPLQEFRVH